VHINTHGIQLTCNECVCGGGGRDVGVVVTLQIPSPPQRLSKSITWTAVRQWKNTTGGGTPPPPPPRYIVAFHLAQLPPPGCTSPFDKL
jgi:hypothetical protein